MRRLLDNFEDRSVSFDAAKITKEKCILNVIKKRHTFLNNFYSRNSESVQTGALIHYVPHQDYG